LAQRDVKSRNILVKNDGTCCIADFGLAVRYPNEKNEVEMGRSNTRVGTKRYMPPEVLSQTINVKNMEDFKQADMYSLGLVLWEMCLKTKTYKDGVEHYETYQLPYSEHVMSDPSCEEMLDIVCHKNLRPSIPTRWDIDEPLCYISKLMKECWMQNPKSRVNMMFVKKNLQQIQHSTFVSKQKSCIIETMTIPRYATINSSSTMSIPLKSAAYQQRQLNSSISS
jgi:bone morphogenetic protein receptor type-1B